MYLKRNWVFVVLCAAISCVRLVAGEQGGDFPRTVGTIVSDARGFGALKILVAIEEVQDELNLSDSAKAKLRSTYDQFVDRMNNRKKEDRRRSRASRMAEFDDEIDDEIEPVLEEILTPVYFREFLRSVVQQRVKPLSPDSVVFRGGTARYLGLDKLKVEDFKTKLSQLNNAPELNVRTNRQQAFKEIVASTPDDFQRRVRDLVGPRFLPHVRH